MHGTLSDQSLIYLQIAQMLEDDILRGVYREEEQVPSTNELSRVYHINPATAAKGLNLLSAEGILYKRRGIGMFVAPGAEQAAAPGKGGGLPGGDRGRTAGHGAPGHRGRRSQMNTGILKAEGLCKSYGSKRVLEGLDLTIQPGRIYGLIGRNGAGKTTLLGILTGQNTKDSGQVTCDGEPVWENCRALEQICFSRELQPTLFSGPNNQKVRYYLKSAAIFYPNWDQEYADRLLNEFQLEPKKKISQLSKGQMSMVTILIALASRAPITILDEPAAGLDVVMRERFYQLLLEDFAQTGRTFLVSTHIIEEAASVFEQVIILDQGRILENSPTEELVEQFRYISGREDVVDQACAGLEVLSVQQMGRHKTAAVRGSDAQFRQVRQADVDVSPMNLQNVFVALCGHGDAQ